MALEVGQLHALEAIERDTASLLLLFTTVRQHRHSALLLPSLMPSAAMFVVESYRCLTKLVPKLGDVLSKTLADQLRPSRQRAKLLDAKKSLEAVVGDLTAIAEQQRSFFLAPHTGFWGPLKRAIQPDLGLSTYDGHMFSTTHSTAFSYGENRDPATSAFSAGEALGSYLVALAILFQMQMPQPLPASVLPGKIEMRDIKSEALYQRGPLRDSSQPVGQPATTPLDITLRSEPSGRSLAGGDGEVCDGRAVGGTLRPARPGPTQRDQPTGPLHRLCQHDLGPHSPPADGPIRWRTCLHAEKGAARL
jgi:hypothetical protein